MASLDDYKRLVGQLLQLQQRQSDGGDFADALQYGTLGDYKVQFQPTYGVQSWDGAPVQTGGQVTFPDVTIGSEGDRWVLPQGDVDAEGRLLNASLSPAELNPGFSINKWGPAIVLGAAGAGAMLGAEAGAASGATPGMYGAEGFAYPAAESAAALPGAYGAEGFSYPAIAESGPVALGTGGAAAPIVASTPSTVVGGGTVAGGLAGASALTGAGGAMSGLGGLSASTLVPAAASLVSGVMGSQAASNAADAQLSAAREAIAEQRRQFDLTRSDFEPYRTAGRTGLQSLMSQMGLQGGTGTLLQPFSMADFQADPGYQFRISEGEKALERASKARGMFDSGSAYKDLLRFNSDQASQEYGNAFNRNLTNRQTIYNMLAGLSGTGQTATGQTATAGSNAANNISQIQQSAGNAAAAGQVASSNAWTNAISQGLNAWNQQQWMDRYPIYNRMSGVQY